MAKGENDDIKKKKETEYLIRKLQNTVYKNYLSSLNIAGVKKAIKDKDDDFFFSNNDTANKEVNKLLSGMANQINYLLLNGIEKEWKQSQESFWEKSESAFVKTKKEKEIFDKIRETATQATRDKTAKTFYYEKRDKGLNISDRVWNLAGNAKKEIEIIIQNGIKEGKSADDIQKSLKGYLNEPEKLFRRVRNKETGKLEWSKAAQKYKPGQGVYRSAYKNAMRLARTELKAANCEAVWNSAQNNPLITGWKITLSNNHTTLINGVPTKFKDICDTLQGTYPKTFKFKGWHPQCRCEMIPILITQEESKKLYKSIFDNKRSEWKPELINKMPDGFNNWVEENKQRQSNWASTPYFIRDNFVNGNLVDGLKYIEPAKPIKTEQQKEDIQARWNTRVASRKYNDQLQEIKTKYGKESDVISDLTDKISKEIKRGADISKIDSMMNELGRKMQVKEAWDERVEINNLETLLVGVKDLKAKFDMQTIHSVFNAVEKKLSTWENLPLEQQVKKLNFEIEWVEKNKKYDTWKAAQDAYKKRLVKVEYLIDKEKIKINISNAVNFTKTTKSSKVKKLATEIEALFDNNAPIHQLQQKALELNNEVAKLEAAKAARAAKKLFGDIKPVDWDDESNYTKARKDSAIWAKTPKEADEKVRSVLETVWQNSTEHEKLSAYRYTAGSSYINEPLRGQSYVGQYNGKYDSKKDADALTSIVNKSSYNFDLWVQRGVDNIGFKGLFGFDIESINIKNLKSIHGKTGIEKAFSSCGLAKGTGFNSKKIIYNIYCTRGTKMLYAEPYSAFGLGSGKTWDGKAQQTNFGVEVEIILQRSTKFRIIKAEYNNGKYYIDLEVIGQ